MLSVNLTRVKNCRWLSLILASFIVGGMLIGCQKNTQTTVTQESKPSAPKPQSIAEQMNNLPGVEPERAKAAMANVELGLGYLAQGQVARAKTKLTHALKLAPDMTEAHSAMAHFLEQTGDIKESEKEHRKAMRLAASLGAVHNNYGAFLCRQGRFKEADQAFQRALSDKEYPRTADVYENAGVCAMKSNDLSAASSYLASALKQDPKRGSALLELSEIELSQSNLAEAGRLFTQYKQLAEPTPRSLWLGLRIAHLLGDHDAVASQGLMLKNLFEDSQEYRLYLQSELGKSS